MNLEQLLENIGVCSWSLRPESASDIVRDLNKIGLSKVQLALNVHRGSLGGIELAEALERNNVEIVSGMFGTVGEDYSSLEAIKVTGGVAPDHQWQENYKLAADIAQLASHLELNLVSFHAGFIPERSDSENYEKIASRVTQIAHLFADKNIDLILETGQETAEDLVEFLEYLDLPNLGVNFDPANMILYAKGEPVQALKTLMPYVKQVHIKDAILTETPGQWGSEVVVGTGQIDWLEFFEVLANSNFAGHMLFEREAGDARVDEISAGYQFVKKILIGEQ